MAHEEGSEAPAVARGGGSLGGSGGWPLLSSLQLDDLLDEVRERAGRAQESQARLGSLLDAVLAISSDLDLPTVLHQIVTSACELVDASYGALGVLGPTGEELVEFVTHGLGEAERAAIGALPHGLGLLGEIIRSPHPLRVTEIAAHPASHGFPANHPPMTSFLGAPVRVRGQVFGNLYLTDKRTAKEFSEDDETIMVALAAAAGVAIENARLYDRTRAQQQWGEVVRGATQSLLDGTDVRDVLGDVATGVLRLAGAQCCAVALSEGPDLVVTATSGGSLLEPGTVVADPDWRSTLAAGRTVLRGGSRRLGGPGDFGDPAGAEDEGRDDPADQVTDAESGSQALVPLVLGGAPLGILVVDWHHGEHTGLLSQLSDFGQNIAIALAAAGAQREKARSQLFEDRDRIARDMHDHVIQRLFATGLSLQSAGRLSSDDVVKERLDTAVDELDAAIKDIRHTIFALHRPPGTRTLSAEITTLCDNAVVTLGFSPDLHIVGRPADVAEPVAADLLAVIREGLSNIARHAGATLATVTVAVVDDLVTVRVSDDGSGVPQGAARSGLNNLARRATVRGGTFTLEAGPTGGTVLTWTVPSQETPSSG